MQTSANPFAQQAMIREVEQFVGRRAESEQIFNLLRSMQNVSLTGARRIGKSSLLYHIYLTGRDRLGEETVIAYTDFRGVQDEATFWDCLCKALGRTGAKLGDFEDALNAHHRVVFCFDEFERVMQKLTEGKVSRDLMPFLRSVMQHRRGISLLFAGTHTLDEMIGELWIPYFRSAVPHRVSYLGEASARKLITNPIADFPLNHDLEAVDRLIAETRCHPCLIQLTCSALVDLKNQQKSHQAAIEDVEQALNEVLKLSGRYVFEGIWEWIPKEERNLLMFAATNELATVPQAARALTMAESRVNGIVERLVEAEVLLRAEGRAEFRFQVPLFRRWVARQAARAGMEWGELRRVAG